MPHVNIKLYPGRSDEQKQALTRRIVDAIRECLDVDSKYVSVAFEEIAPEDWEETVVKPELRAKKHLLTKEPGYLD